MRTREKQLLVIIIALVLSLIVVLIGVLVYLNSDGTEPGGKEIIISGTNSSGTESNSGPEYIPEDEENSEGILADGIEIETPCGKIFYPESWREYLETEVTEDPYTVIFYSNIGNHEKNRIFDITFGAGTGEYFGNVKGQNGTVYPIYTKVYTLADLSGWNESEIEILENMQEDINRVLDQLELTDEKPENNSGDLEIKVGGIVFSYPMIWKEWLETEETENGIKLYAKVGNHEREQLFDIVLSTEGEVPVGEMKTGNGKTIDITIDIYDPIFDESWTEEEKQIVLAMGEEMNYVVTKLSENENFIPGY